MLAPQLVAAGRARLLACDWDGAHAQFAAALAVETSPDAITGLGHARYWQGDYREALDLLEDGYRRHRAAGNRRRAARVAIQLAQLHALIHANGAAMNGWIAHAVRMLEATEDAGAERGWVEVFLACIATDPAQRQSHATTAVELGRRHRVRGLEFTALAYLGQARIEQGDFAEGLDLVDEAVVSASSGLVADPWSEGEIYCTLFRACELTGDVQRANDWLATVDDYVDRTGELPIRGICRMHYGGLLITAGDWDQAAVELQAALECLWSRYRGSRTEPLLLLAELRARQGRFEEAQRLLEGLEDLAGAALPRARLAMAAGLAPVAAALLQRDLDRRGRGPLHATEMSLLVCAEVAQGHLDVALGVAVALDQLACRTGQPSIVGRANLARARVAVGSDDPTARRYYEDALAALAVAHLPWELATARLEYAELVAASSPEVALVEATTAHRVLQELGAGETDRAASLVRRLGGPVPTPSRASGATLTPRQSQVLGLLVEGRSNVEIAERLWISPRTAEHHVSNILAALGVSSRAEAIALALRRDDS